MSALPPKIFSAVIEKKKQENMSQEDPCTQRTLRGWLLICEMIFVHGIPEKRDCIRDHVPPAFYLEKFQILKKTQYISWNICIPVP